VPVQVDLRPFDLKSGVLVTCDVGYLCANFGLLRHLCSRVIPDVRERQTDRRQTASSLNAPAYGRGLNNSAPYWVPFWRKLVASDVGWISEFKTVVVGSAMRLLNFELSSLIPRTIDLYYRYAGSLTTPGCFQSVVWTVVTTPLQISCNQVKYVERPC